MLKYILKFYLLLVTGCGPAVIDNSSVLGTNEKSMGAESVKSDKIKKERNFVEESAPVDSEDLGAVSEKEDMVRVTVPKLVFMGTVPMTYYEGDIPPRRKVILKDFEIDRLEVTVANWRECEKAGVCKPARSGEIGIRPEDRCNAYLPDKENHPVNCVSWEMAKIYCSRKNKRLPSAGEWEYAAFGGNFGGEGRKYPWGNEKPEDGRGCYQPSIDPCYEYEDYKDNCEQAEPDDCCHNRRRTCRVGSYPDGASPFGALDMYGNLWEWTSDRPGELSGEPQETTYVAVAGGSTQDAGITNPFYTMEESGHYLAVGFRCVR